MIKKALFALAGFVVVITSIIVTTSCSVDSANAVYRSVSANVAGFYSYSSGNCDNEGRFVTANSGAQVTSFDLRQSGDQLEAIDNNGIIFRGTIGDVADTSASFNLEGSTTKGSSVTVSGSIAIGGGQGVMRATWIEDSFYATLCGAANGPSVVTNTPDTNTNSNSSTSIGFKFKSTDEMAAYRKTVLWFYEG